MAATEHGPHHWYDALAVIARRARSTGTTCSGGRAGGPRRMLSLLLYAESNDLAVPAGAVSLLYERTHPSGLVTDPSAVGRAREPVGPCDRRLRLPGRGVRGRERPDRRGWSGVRAQPGDADRRDRGRPQRGLFLGNRGSIHRGHDDRPAVAGPAVDHLRAEHKGWRAPMWEPGRWTPLFFWDEAVALAAGHRPCALCRHADHVRWLDAWEAATASGRGSTRWTAASTRSGSRATAGAAAAPTCPGPTCRRARSSVDGDGPALVLDDRVVPWTPRRRLRRSGRPRPRRGGGAVLTPPATVAVLAHGYAPVLHPSLG